MLESGDVEVFVMTKIKKQNKLFFAFDSPDTPL
jgi:hypothetical protein